MLDQEDEPELDDEWLTADEKLTRFSKAREQIVGGVKGTESPYVQGQGLNQCQKALEIVTFGVVQHMF